MSPALRHFGRELKLAREAAGMTQEQLARAINFAKSTVAMIETGQRPAKRDFTVPVDDLLKSEGRFERMRRDLLVAEVRPEWFRPWVHYESEATEIRWYEPLLVPGLLQTEAYARALLGEDDKVVARLERQHVLERASVLVIIDEWVLQRRIGDAATMAEQLHRLATAAPAIVQVLPATADTCLGTAGSFALAAVDGTEVAYVDTPARGFVLAEAQVVFDVRRRWERLLAEALPRSLSQELISKAAEQWKAAES